MRVREVNGFLLFLALPCVAKAAAPGCDIAAIDFKNRVITAAANGVVPGRALRLRNGSFSEWDRPDNRNLARQKPDWLTTIERDVLLRPPDSGGVRLLVLNRVHLTGSGSFTYVFGFRCVSGSLTKIFEISGEGLRLEKASDDGIELTRPIWKPDDPHCCPSREERPRYLWSRARQEFVQNKAGPK